MAERFDTFFPRLAEFQKAPRHPKWREANLAATLPGWTRFAGAEEWLRLQRTTWEHRLDRLGDVLAESAADGATTPDDPVKEPRS